MLRFKLVDLYVVNKFASKFFFVFRILTILVGCGWLTNLSLLLRFYSSVQCDNSIKSYRVYDLLLQTDTVVKTVFSDSGGLKT